MRHKNTKLTIVVNTNLKEENTKLPAPQTFNTFSTLICSLNPTNDGALLFRTLSYFSLVQTLLTKTFYAKLDLCRKNRIRH